jgi:rhamnosyltransferase
MAYPRVATLMAAYNGEKWINEQIKSILNQENVDITLYISIDQSTDRTVEIVENIARVNRNVIILPYGRKYGSAVANFFRLMREVNIKDYDFIGFADQDDIWVNTKYKIAIDCMKGSGSSGYSSNVEAFWNNGVKKIINKAQNQVRWDYLFEGGGAGCTYLLENNLAVMLQNYLIKNKDIDDKISHHDWFYYAFARARGIKWIIDKRANVLYRQHEANTEGANIGWKAIVYRIKDVIFGNWIKQSFSIIAIDTERCSLLQERLSTPRVFWSFLAIHCNQCRRKQRDKIIFFGACLLLALLGKKE